MITDGFRTILRVTFLSAALASATAGCSSSLEGGGATAVPAGGQEAAGTDTGQPGGRGKGPLEYRLASGDQLQVSVFGQPDLSGKFEVDSNGNLILPLIGQISAEGKTATEVQNNLAEALNKSFLVNPKVTVQVLNYRPFYILGEVNKPGSYPYVAGITMRQAVAIAGGYTRRARATPVRVIHSGKTASESDEATPDDPVLPGDTIEVERRLF